MPGGLEGRSARGGKEGHQNHHASSGRWSRSSAGCTPCFVSRLGGSHKGSFECWSHSPTVADVRPTGEEEEERNAPHISAARVVKAIFPGVGYACLRVVGQSASLPVKSP
jgi:hypothetical protein